MSNVQPVRGADDAILQYDRMLDFVVKYERVYQSEDDKLAYVEFAAGSGFIAPGFFSFASLSI